MHLTSRSKVLAVHDRSSVRRARVGGKPSCPPTLDEAVNKRDVSTRETGEFARENAGFNLNLGFASAAPRDLSSNRRESTASQNLRNVADTGKAAVARCCQENHGLEFGRNGGGSPETMVSNHLSAFSSTFDLRIGRSMLAQPRVEFLKPQRTGLIQPHQESEHLVIIKDQMVSIHLQECRSDRHRHALVSV